MAAWTDFVSTTVRSITTTTTATATKKKTTMSDKGIGDNQNNEDTLLDEDNDDDVPSYVKSVYPPLKVIEEIKNEMADRRIEDDMLFIEQLQQDPYFLKVTKEMFDSGLNHSWVRHDESKRSLFMTIARDLDRRLDYCVILAQEIDLGDYDLDVVRKVDGVITSTMSLCSKFVLTKEEKKEDVSRREAEGREETETLLYTHFSIITNSFNVVKKHHKKVLRKLYALEKLVKMAKDDDSNFSSMEETESRGNDVSSMEETESQRAQKPQTPEKPESQFRWRVGQTPEKM